MLLDLVPAIDVQGGLFDRPDDPKAIARMKAIDALNGRYRCDTITFSASGRKRGWKLRSHVVSPRYTKAWEDLLAV